MSLHSYIHDKLTVFMNLVLILLGLFNIILVVLRIDTTQAAAVIRFNTSLGIAGFERADTSQLYQFALIPLIIVISQTLLAWKVHKMKRATSLLVLGLGIIALIFSIVVSTAILNLHR